MSGNVEAAQARRVELSAQWWEYACRSARLHRDGHPPPEIAVHGLILEKTERALLMTNATYTRRYGSNGTYYRQSIFAFGHPAVVAGALAGTALVNSARKRAAQQAAQVSWRDQQEVDVLVTDRRLFCNTRQRGWMSFWFNSVAELYPNLDDWSLTLGFRSATPLRLAGPAAPALALWTSVGVLGSRWTGDPRLASLLS